MVAVVVDDPDAIDHAGGGEAALDPGKGGQTLPDATVGDAELPRHGDGGQGVQHIVAPGDRQLQPFQPQRLTLDRRDHHVEARALGAHLDIHSPNLCLGIGAVGDDPAIGDPRRHGLNLGVIEADHRAAIEGDALDEVLEGPLHRLEVTPVVEMLGVDVGHHRDGGLQI